MIITKTFPAEFSSSWEYDGFFPYFRIQEQHAIIRNNGSKVTMEPVNGSKIYVNGLKLKEKAELHHLVKIWPFIERPFEKAFAMLNKLRNSWYQTCIIWLTWIRASLYRAESSLVPVAYTCLLGKYLRENQMMRRSMITIISWLSWQSIVEWP